MATEILRTMREEIAQALRIPVWIRQSCIRSPCDAGLLAPEGGYRMTDKLLELARGLAD